MFIIQHCTPAESNTIHQAATLNEAITFVNAETIWETIVDGESNNVFWFEVYDTSKGETPEEWEMVIITPRYANRF